MHRCRMSPVRGASWHRPDRLITRAPAGRSPAGVCGSGYGSGCDVLDGPHLLGLAGCSLQLEYQRAEDDERRDHESDGGVDGIASDGRPAPRVEKRGAKHLAWNSVAFWPARVASCAWSVA